MQIAGLQRVNGRVAFAAFVVGAVAVTWIFFARFTEEDEWRGFLVTGIRQIPLFVPLAASALSAAFFWMITSAVRPSFARGLLVGLPTILVASYATIVIAGLLAGDEPFNVVFFGTLFFPMYLTLPEAWTSLLVLPFIGALANAWARQAQLP